MRLYPTPQAVVLASVLTACTASTPSADKIALAAPPAALLAPCARAVLVPDTATTAGAQEALWLEDRAALATCRARHAALARWAKAITAVFGVN